MVLEITMEMLKSHPGFHSLWWYSLGLSLVIISWTLTTQQRTFVKELELSYSAPTRKWLWMFWLAYKVKTQQRPDRFGPCSAAWKHYERILARRFLSSCWGVLESPRTIIVLLSPLYFSYFVWECFRLDIMFNTKLFADSKTWEKKLFQ